MAMASERSVHTIDPSKDDGYQDQSAAKSGALGTLSILPRELRDNIYQLSLAVERFPQDACFCGNDEWDGPCCYRGYTRTCYIWYKPSLPNKDRKTKTSSQKWEGGSFSLLGVSLAIRAEALDALNTWGHFMFPEPYLGHKVERYDIPLLDVISDLRLRFIIDQPGDRHFEKPLLCTTDFGAINATPAHPLPYFTGHDPQRKTCAIEIWYSRSGGLPMLLQSPLCDAIRELTGFENVVLVFIFEKIRPGGVFCRSNYDETDMAAFSALTTTFSTALEPKLGPSKSTGIKQCGKPRIHEVFWHTLERSIEFHPRTHLSRKNASNESSQQVGIPHTR